ncbi:MAG: class I SAM-dependent methyltransferase [Rubricoccaceae bacterium]
MRTLKLLLVGLFVLAPLACQAQRAERPAASAGVASTAAAAAAQSLAARGYADGPASADGTGRFYFGREIARVMSHHGAAWLERPERDRTERPDEVVANLGLRPGMTVADLGAGTGYFTFRLAARVPEGRVFAVDIQPEMLAILARRNAEEGTGNVEPVLGTETDPRLPDATVDVTLLVDSYHEFSHPREMLDAIYRATRPGGRLVLVEYRAEDPSVPIRPLHKMTEAQVRLEVEAAGFRFVENRGFLPQQHFLVFERPR